MEIYEHLKNVFSLTSQKYIRTFCLGSKIRRCYKKKKISVVRMLYLRAIAIVDSWECPALLLRLKIMVQKLVFFTPVS